MFDKLKKDKDYNFGMLARPEQDPYMDPTDPEVSNYLDPLALAQQPKEETPEPMMSPLAPKQQGPSDDELYGAGIRDSSMSDEQFNKMHQENSQKELDALKSDKKDNKNKAKMIGAVSDALAGIAGAGAKELGRDIGNIDAMKVSSGTPYMQKLRQQFGVV